MDGETSRQERYNIYTSLYSSGTLLITRKQLYHGLHHAPATQAHQHAGSSFQNRFSIRSRASFSLQQTDDQFLHFAHYFPRKS
ncbi:hypothetical protein EYC84_004752 [Monilinia fructicola]|uniref:Uncharacterized protein n=1 Tax=Monilinia fructicola TaxID=38448 RepID=A0A5M9K1F3_MONFR|nr:hypothetical protein EYC84_004752 [Monilinia fructicola]